jgi:hypothetical protein
MSLLAVRSAPFLLSDFCSSIRSVSVSSSLSDMASSSLDLSSSHDTLNLEDVKRQLSQCCSSCGVCWADEHFSFDCAECGGYSMIRPCVNCGGTCGALFTRDFALVSCLWGLGTSCGDCTQVTTIANEISSFPTESRKPQRKVEGQLQPLPQPQQPATRVQHQLHLTHHHGFDDMRHEPVLPQRPSPSTREARDQVLKSAVVGAIFSTLNQSSHANDRKSQNIFEFSQQSTKASRCVVIGGGEGQGKRRRGKVKESESRFVFWF